MSLSNAQPTVFTIHRALLRSRQTILTSLLPVYTPSATDNKHGTVETGLRRVCSSTVKIGPHIFSDTIVMSTEDSVTSSPAPKRRKTEATSPAAGSGTAAALAITPALIKRLNVASASNADLAQCLRKAANGTASQQELAKLAKLIDEIGKNDNSGATNDPDASNKASTSKANVASTSIAQAAMSTQDAASLDPPKLVLQFRENPAVLFSVPNHFQHSVHASAKADAAPDRDVDILLSFFVTPELEKGKQRASASEESAAEDATVIPVDVVIEECDLVMQAAIAKCSRTSRKKDPRVEEWWKKSIQQAPFRFSFVHPPPSDTAAYDIPESDGDEPYPIFVRETKEFVKGVPGGLGKARREQEMIGMSSVKAAPKKRRRR
ncbi:hypothetical protein OIV83_000182 [Microbotryomycetes sp. JL201]|nr:hypothetical protein OIV83_000182 [Microbotryomycetes sp. JL201]